MLPPLRYLAATSLVLACIQPVAGQPSADPIVDGKKASEWVNVLQNDASARQRAIAISALAAAWTGHRYKDALANVGRSLRVDPSAAVRSQAAVIIAGLKPDDARAIETEIVDALRKEKEPRVRKELVVAIGRFPAIARKAAGPLTTALADADPIARAAAADALAKAGSDAKGAAPELLLLIGDPDKAVRQSAAFALGRVAPDNPSFVAAALVDRLSAEKDADIRRELLVSVGLIGEKSEVVVAQLTSAVADPDDAVRAVAIRTLGTFGTAARPAAAALLAVAGGTGDTAARVDAVRSFGSVLGPDLKGRLKDAIQLMENDPAFEVRLAVVEEIGALGNEIRDDKEALAALRKRLSDPQVKVREAAAVAMQRIEKKAEKRPNPPPQIKP